MMLNEQQKQLLKSLDKSIKMAEAISILNNKELSEQEKYNKLWDMIIKEIMKQISENSRGY
ncbi:MAG: hypothetical protein IJ218_00715 [Alphaproteobacteria bacterium]|jgi:hypothetical protein|nr:hypothetical protein [Alphaproteobacteria bacterium]